METITFVKLSAQFFEAHKEDLEITKKETRPHLQGAVLYDEKNTFFIPLRSNCNPYHMKKYPELYVPLPLEGKPNAGLDLRKTVVIDSGQLKDFTVEAFVKIPKQQLMELKKVNVDRLLTNYLSDYRQHSNRQKYKISAFQYFHKELGIKPTQEPTQKKKLNNKGTNVVSVTDEMIEQAKHTRILDYVKYYGIPVKRTSGAEYELVERKNVKFDTRKNLFKDYNPSQNAGGDIINFAKYIDGVNFPQAIQKILAVDGSGNFDFSLVQSQPFVMPQIFETDGRFNEVMTYLVNERKFEASTIKKLVENGLIKQTQNKEVAFIWADGEKDVGMTLQGTKKLEYETSTFEMEDKEGGKKTAWLLKRKGKREPLAYGLVESQEEAQKAGALALKKERQYKKQIWRNSTTGHGFNFRSGTLKSEAQGKIVFTEAAMDAIAYFELKGQDFGNETRVHYQSLEGLKDNILYKSMERYEKRYGKCPEEIILAVDNDVSGEAFVKKIMADKRLKVYQEKGGKITRDKASEGKDFNEQLQVEKEKKRQSLTACQELDEGRDI